MEPIEQVWLPDLMYMGGRFQHELALVSDANGRIVRIAPAQDLRNVNIIRLKNRALLPGLVNAHSHAFQRVIRGRTEYRTRNIKDSFWTWREMMYEAANRLTPESIYDASRMAFLEMVLSGITVVGEFHYIHHAPDGTRYDDPNLIAKEVVRAAKDVGLRIALLLVAYVRAGYRRKPNPEQARFIEPDPQIYLSRLEDLTSELEETKGQAWVGIAPHSVRAVPLDYLKEIVRYGNSQDLPIHMHLAEQPAEIWACLEEYERMPVALLQSEGVLSKRFTGVHAIHIDPADARALAVAGARICACPTTERNLGDGVVPADLFLKEGVEVALGTDSNTQTDLLEDARELEYHLRLLKVERVVLSPPEDNSRAGLAERLFQCATSNGARSIGSQTGKLEPGLATDFFTVDLDDPSIAGSEKDNLLPIIVFSVCRAAVRDVVVGGKRIVSDGRHPSQDEIVRNFNQIQRQLWN